MNKVVDNWLLQNIRDKQNSNYWAEIHLNLIEAFETHKQTLSVNGKNIRITIPAGNDDTKLKNQLDIFKSFIWKCVNYVTYSKSYVTLTGLNWDTFESWN